MFAGRQRPVKKGNEAQPPTAAAPIRNTLNQAPVAQTASQEQISPQSSPSLPTRSTEGTVKSSASKRVSLLNNTGAYSGLGSLNTSGAQLPLSTISDNPGDEVNTLPSTVTDVMTIIRLSWDFMTNPEFNPVPFALSLIDGSSLGNDYNSFCNTCDQVEKAMDIVVNDYHMAFNNSIQRFSSVVDTISDSQNRVKDIIDNLDMSKDTLECKRFDFLHLWVKSIQYKEMSRILDSIVELQATQTQLESLVQEKHYLHAVRILTAAEKIVNNHDLENVLALASIRFQFNKTKTFLKETLTAELSNHLYLKNRSAFNRIGKDAPPVTNLKVELAGSPTSDLLRFAKNTVMLDEVNIDGTNADFDSFNQMQVVLEGLFHLGTLGETMTFIQDRISMEIYNVIDRVLSEIQNQYCKDDADVNADGSNTMPNHTIFQLFLAVLYQRLQAIVEGHSFVIDCSHGLIQASIEPSNSSNPVKLSSLTRSTENELHHGSFDQGLNSPNSTTSSNIELDSLKRVSTPGEIRVYGLRAVATSIQNEVKGLLYDYLKSSDSSAIATVPPVLAITEMLKENKKGLKRQIKQLYYLKTSADDYVKKIFKETCPTGTTITTPLSADLPTPPSPTTLLDAFPLDFPSDTPDASNGHRLLVPPHPSHILVSYKPTLDFMMSLERKVNLRLTNFKMYLDDFVFNVYLPAVQEQVLVYYHASVNGIDAFQADMYPDALYPLIKSGLGIVLEMNGVCRIIKSMPAHSTELVKMVQTLLSKFYEKCWSRLRNVIAAEEVGMAETGSEENLDEKGMNILSAAWAQNEELVQLYYQNTYINAPKVNVEENKDLAQKETAIQMQLKGERSIHRSELLMQPRKIQYLSNLAYGIEWVLDQIKYLRDSKDKNDSSSSYVTSTAKTLMRAFSNLSEDSLLNINFDSDTTIELPTATEELQDAFDELENDFQRLILQILYIIRNEVRCHTIYYLDLAIREGSYVGDELHPEPDPYIGLLNTDLTEMEEIITNSLPPRQARFIFDGIAGLMCTVLIHNVRQLRQVTASGVDRLLSNVVSLQQNLISFTSLYEREKDMEKCKKYLYLFHMTGPGIMSFLSKNGGIFTYEEYKSVIDLIYNDATSLPKNEGKETLFNLKDYFVNHRS